MNRLSSRAAGCLLLLSVFVPVACAQSAPVLFYSDLDSGPPTGGEGGRDGAFVCIFGEHFGSSRGSSTISIGGVPAAAYKLWLDPGEPYRPAHYAKACVQIGRSTPIGKAKIELTTSRGTSNPLSFAVRPGSIYFVGASGDDRSGDGSSDHPWSTIKQCKNRLKPGDICYIRDGVRTTANDTYGAAIALTSSGEAGRPKTLAAYPGATVIVGNSSIPGTVRALTNLDRSAEIGNWTIAGLTFDSPHTTIQLSRGSGIRMVDNDVLCTGDHCYGYDAGLLVGGPGVTPSGITLLGNRIHDVGCHDNADYQSSPHPCAWIQAGKTTISTAGTNWKTSQWTTSFGPGYTIEANGQLRRVETCDPGCRSGKLDAPFAPDLAEGTTWKYRFPSPPKFFHSVYFGNTNAVEFGWNEIDGKQGKACRGLLFHSTAGNDEFDLHVHDNDIHDTVCDCLAFATVDPEQGMVEAYNNTLYRCGTGSAMVMQSSFAGVYLSNDLDGLPNPTRGGKVQVYDNTVYNAGVGRSTGNNTSCFAVKLITTPVHPAAGLELTNNMCVQPGVNGQSYFTATGVEQSGGHPLSYYVGGSNNECFGAGPSCPPELSNSLSVPPNFVNAEAENFRLAADSKLRNAGAASKALTDQDGKPRGPKPNVGAF